jgi:opacity protein-like surface antigen
MRILVTLITFATLLTGVAQAQTSPAPTPAATTSKGYVEAVAQSAFGNVTSQSYGGEGGYTVWKNVQVFVEFGQIRNVAPAELGAAAQLIAGYLSQTQGNVTFSVKEPASFGAGGVKYLIPVGGAKFEPYVMVGFGVAKVTKDVVFTVGGSDVTSQLGNLGVVLGSDLSGEFSKPIVTFGGGVSWLLWRQLTADLQFRFTHIGAEDATESATNVGRAGVGIGVRF